MADETKADAAAAAEAPARLAETVADASVKLARTSEKAANSAASATSTVANRVARRTRAAVAKAPDAATAVRRPKAAAAAAAKPAKAARRAKPARRRKTSTPRPAAAKERKTTVTFDPNKIFAGFGAVPGAAPFQSLFSEATERSQEAVKRSQKVAEELADLTRANVEALVESGRIAVEGARSLGQDYVAKSRESVEKAADAVRTLAEAKSPTEFIQLQTDYARTSFDRLVNESSKLTESFVKLAGEAFQPLSTRATANAERLSELVA